MPELPEVETVRKVLGQQLRDRRILNVSIRKPQVVAYPQESVFKSELEGVKIETLARRGKFLITRLESGKDLVIHLRMTGSLVVIPENDEEEKHTHIVFTLDNHLKLCFSDQRRFGRMWLVGNKEEYGLTGIGKLGPEPFSKEMNAAYLKARLGKRTKAIKECLMDQNVIAGIGNIYSDEILFGAGIRPNRPAKKTTGKEWETLSQIIPEYLSFFIEKNEMSAEDYLLSKGKDYRNTPYLKVYGSAGKPCPKCGTILVRKTIGGRSSVYCPACQK